MDLSPRTLSVLAVAILAGTTVHSESVSNAAELRIFSLQELGQVPAPEDKPDSTPTSKPDPCPPCGLG